MAVIHKDHAEKLSGFATLTGTPKQVGEELKRLKTGHVVALALEYGSDAELNALAETVKSIAPLVGTIHELRQSEVLEAIITALVPQTPPPQHALIEARMTAERARRCSPMATG